MDGEIDATLTPEIGTATTGRYTMWLRNRGTEPVTLQLVARLEQVGGRVLIDPATVRVAPGGTAEARIATHPRRRFAGGPTSYAVSVAGRELSGAGAEIVTVRATGSAPARTGAWAAVTGIVALLAGGVLIAWLVLDRLPFLDRDAAPPGDTNATSAATAVRRPYVLVDSYPQLAPEDRTAAEASVARLTQAGLPVRLIDSRASADIADGTSGFWVVLQDGFASVAEADKFCDRYRGVTPQCQVFR